MNRIHFSLLDDKRYLIEIVKLFSSQMTDEHELVLDVGWSRTTSLPLTEGFTICKIIHNNGHDNNNVNHTILTPGQAPAGSRIFNPGISGMGFCKIPGSRDFSGRD